MHGWKPAKAGLPRLRAGTSAEWDA